MNERARMWLCRMYRSRGLGFSDEAWPDFAFFCETSTDVDLTEEPPMGRRVDGRDPWLVQFGLCDMGEWPFAHEVIPRQVGRQELIDKQYAHLPPKVTW